MGGGGGGGGGGEDRYVFRLKGICIETISWGK